MRSIDETFETFGKRVLWLGYAGEEDRSTLIVDLHDILLEFPGATAVLKVRPPDEKAAYPAITETIDDKLHWSISDSDTAKEGRGELQLSLISPTGSKIKTAVAAMEISRSLPDGGQKPDRIDDWMEKAEAARKKAEEAATKANTAASNADTAASKAEAKADLANDAATKADTATTKANEATSKANPAASNADTATSKANTATSKANTAASNADTATSNANAATTKANEATSKANTAASNADAKAKLANDAAKRAEDAAEKADKACQNILIGSETGNTVSVSDVFSAPLCGLTVYGKSTQDGTPSPDNPVPIVSAGDGGSVVVTLSDGNGKTQTLTLSTPTGLPGIPVTFGGNYTDQNGQQWVCDEVDLERGVKVQRVTTVDLSTCTSVGTVELAVTKRITLWLPFKCLDTNMKALCNKLQHVVSFIKDSPHFYIDATRADVSIAQVFIPIGAKNPEEGEYILFYALATPIETPLTPDELAAYKALTTYAPNTVVQAADGAGLKLDYQRDVNIVIKNLEDAIASMTIT